MIKEVIYPKISIVAYSNLLFKFVFLSKNQNSNIPKMILAKTIKGLVSKLARVVTETVGQ